MPKKKKDAMQHEADSFDPDVTVDVSLACETCKHSDERGMPDSSDICCECAQSEHLCPNYALRILTSNSHWLASETVTVTQELTQAEKAEYAEEMANAQGEKDRLELELDGFKKQYKRLIDAEDAKISKAARIVRNGKEDRDILCNKVADYNTCEIVWSDVHTPHTEVQRRKMTAEERQLPLEMRGKPEEDQPRACETCVHYLSEDVTGERDCNAPDDHDCGPDLFGWEPIPPATTEAEQAEAVQ